MLLGHKTSTLPERFDRKHVSIISWRWDWVSAQAASKKRQWQDQCCSIRWMCSRSPSAPGGDRQELPQVNMWNINDLVCTGDQNQGTVYKQLSFSWNNVIFTAEGLKDFLSCLYHATRTVFPQNNWGISTNTQPNPIESLWKILADKIMAQKPSTVTKLWRGLEGEWVKITAEQCEGRVLYCGPRCAEDMKSRGLHISC